MHETRTASRPDGPVPVVLAASGAAWEADVVALLAAAGRRMMLLKRCLDLPDLLATAASGTVRVAVVSDRLPGLDADSVGRLARHGVRVVAVLAPDPRAAAAHDAAAASSRLSRLGVARVLGPDGLESLGREVSALAAAPPAPLGARAAAEGQGGAAPRLDCAGTAHVEPLPWTMGGSSGSPGRRGRLVAVWGTSGAPGRTTVALALASRAAACGHGVTLVDADAYGGAAAQHLAVLDGASGLLAAARMANSGGLDPARLAGAAREVAPGLRLVTGLPHPDRWGEVRAAAFERVLEVARDLDDLVVVDTGAGLPATPADPFDATPSRDDMALVAVQQADDVVVVAVPDPVGLSRLARALRDLRDVRPHGPVDVVVNRMRPTLGWTEADVTGLLARVAHDARVAFVPDDRGAADRALVSGRTLLDCADAGLRRSLAALADAVADGHDAAEPAGRLRLRLRR